MSRVRRIPRRTLVLGVSLAAALAGFASLAAASYITGTPGNDSITVAESGAVAHLLAGDDSFVGAAGADGGGDHVYGGHDDDVIRTRTFVDALRGNSGNDELRGGPQQDVMIGDNGADTLIGGGGVDLFRPGKGVDTCVGQLKDQHFPRKCEIVQIVGN